MSKNSPLKLRPLQVEATYYLMSHPKAFLCLRMRLGKTATSLQFAHKGKPTLVVAPVSVLYHWQDEVNLWRPELTTKVLRKGTDRQGSEDVTIVPYSIFPALLQNGNLKKPDYFIVDESHYVKNLKAKRTRAVCTVFKKAERAVALTGTPIPNRPIELYPLLKAMEAPFAKNKAQFGMRYCDGKPSIWTHGMDMTGASNLDELQRNLEHYMFYSQGGYVPPVTTVFPVTGTVSKEERRLIDSIDWSSEEPKIPFEQLAEIRSLTGQGKRQVALDHVLDCLQELEKVVVFAHHKVVIDDLKTDLEDRGIGVVTLTGKDTPEQRSRAVNQFNADPHTEVFIGNIQASGEGISLAAASHAVFVEQAWTPGAMDQAAARIETADMNRVTTIDYLVKRGGIDSKLLAKIQEKREIVSQALNDRGAV